MELQGPIELEVWNDTRPAVTKLLDGVVGELVGRNRARDPDMIDYWEEVFESAINELRRLKQLRIGGKGDNHDG